MVFKVIKPRKGYPIKADPDTCVLKMDNWDDFGFSTLYELIYYDENGDSKYIGVVKIIKAGQERGVSVLNEESLFEALNKDFCSLGQDQSYYEELMTLTSKVKNNILVSLRDCVHDIDIYNAFENEDAMRNSLLRFVRVKDVETKFKNILLGNIILTPYHFQYILESNPESVIDVEVIPDSKPPTNVHVLIGRNGAGKTRILSGIADELTNNKEKKNRIGIPGEILFLGESKENGRFSNLVTIVFSAFDNFSPIKAQYVKGNIRYQYVGLKKFLGKKDNEKVLRFKTAINLKNEFKSSLEICLESQRKSRWIEAIKILNSDPHLEEYDLDELANTTDGIKEIGNIFNKLSSGHKLIGAEVAKR